MSPRSCFYHPDQTASAVCTQCQKPLCGQCIELVANQPVCTNCVAAIRARVASQMNVAGSAPGAWPPQAQAVSVQSLGSASAKDLLLGAVYGLLAGVVGAFLLAKIEQISHFEIAYLNALVGYGVGYAVLMGDKRGGTPPAVVGGILALFSMLLSEYFMLQGAVSVYAAQNNMALPAINAGMYIAFLRHLDIIDWVCIAIGVYGGIKTPLRAQRQYRRMM